MKRILFGYDQHLGEDVQDSSYLVWRKYLKDFKPDLTVLGGDFMDCESISHWINDKKRKVEGKRWRKECDVANKELDYIQKYSKKVVYLEGNHEDWVEQYLDRHPEVEGIFELSHMLKLEERKIDLYRMNTLYKVTENLYATHGMYTGKYHANQHLNNLGCNIVYGHTHHPQVEMHNMKMQEPYKAWCLGCLCGHEPSYMRRKNANWMNGFGICYDYGSQFNMYVIDIIGGRFISPEGRLYK